MKERPILFNSEMVRAIIDGRKTQTRRVVKPPKNWPEYSYCDPFAMPPDVWWWNGEHDRVGVRQECPFGKVGDRLWLRETFRLFDSHTECACYDDCRCAAMDGNPIYRADEDDAGATWKPSIHMPRSASRITLEITNVRLERLNAISEEDAMAEGIDLNDWYSGNPHYRHAFMQLWSKIYGAESWDKNPWVWVIEFRRVEK